MQTEKSVLSNRNNAMKTGKTKREKMSLSVSNSDKTRSSFPVVLEDLSNEKKKKNYKYV